MLNAVPKNRIVAAKTHRRGKGAVIQLCDIEQVDEIDDKHRKQPDARRQRHHRDVLQRAAGQKYGGLGCDGENVLMCQALTGSGNMRLCRNAL